MHSHNRHLITAAPAYYLMTQGHRHLITAAPAHDLMTQSQRPTR